ncbi:hypothetical protein NL676_036083 [Syzygium grande]|nr:hypothetical protein NL676_036083 [Syzygium grande]
MITSLCGVRFRRRPHSSDKDGKEKDSPTYKSKITETAAVAAAAGIASAPQANGKAEFDDAKVEIPRSQELPLPPARKHLNESHSYNHLPRSASRKNNLKMNSSVKIARSRSVSKHVQDGKQEKLKREDSIWTKAIILGEKCRVPDDDDDGAIIYDNQGNRISTYRARTPRSLTISRTSSMIDQDAIPSQKVVCSLVPPRHVTWFPGKPEPAGGGANQIEALFNGTRQRGPRGRRGIWSGPATTSLQNASSYFASASCSKLGLQEAPPDSGIRPALEIPGIGSSKRHRLQPASPLDRYRRGRICCPQISRDIIVSGSRVFFLVLDLEEGSFADERREGDWLANIPKASRGVLGPLSLLPFEREAVSFCTQRDRWDKAFFELQGG